MRKLRLYCLALAVLLLLSACSSTEAEPQSNSLSLAVGYSEENITPDGTISGGKLSAFADGRIVYLAYVNGKNPVAFVCNAETAVFEKMENTAAKTLVEQAGENVDISMAVSAAGQWWVSIQRPDDLLPTLTAVSSDETQAVIPIQHSGDADGRYTAQAVMQDGSNVVSILLTLQDESQSERFLCSFDAASRKQLSCIRCPVGTLSATVKSGTAYLLDGSGGLGIYNIASGQKESNQVLPNEMVGDLIKSSFCIDDSGNLCSVSGSGIQKIALGGDKPQSVLFDESHAYAGAAFSRSSIVALSDNQFMVAFSEMGKGKIFMYNYGEHETAEPQQLHIWALEEQPILREAVMQYQRANSHVSIKVEYGRFHGESAQTDEDIIRSLNTQMLADECPDILILDGLPCERYFSSGMLRNLDGLIDENNFYNNVISCYKTTSGTFAYPALFRIPAIISTAGNEDVLASVTSLQALYGLCKNANALYFNNYEDMFNTLYSAYSAAMFHRNAEVVEAEVYRFLEATKSIAEGLGLTAQARYLYGDGTPPQNAYITAAQGIVGFQVERDFGAAILNDYSDIYLSAHLRGAIRCVPLPGNVFVPYISIAIPSGSTNADSARDFATFMLTDSAVQSSIYKAGFSVRKNSDQAEYRQFLTEALADPDYMTPLDDNLSFHLDALISQLDNKTAGSVVLQNKLYEQALRFYQGEVDIDTATADVMRNVQIYLHEQQ